MTLEELKARRAARGMSDPLNRMRARAIDPDSVVYERRACLLEGWTHGTLSGFTSQDAQGFFARSNCGKVSIRLSAATVARKYDGESCPSIYYE